MIVFLHTFKKLVNNMKKRIQYLLKFTFMNNFRNCILRSRKIKKDYKLMKFKLKNRFLIKIKDRYNSSICHMDLQHHQT